MWSLRLTMGVTKWQSKKYDNRGGDCTMGEVADFKLTTGPNVLKAWLALCEICSRCTSL